MPQITQFTDMFPEQYQRPAHADCMDNTTQSTEEQVTDSDRNLVHVVVMAGRAASN